MFDIFKNLRVQLGVLPRTKSLSNHILYPELQSNRKTRRCGMKLPPMRTCLVSSELLSSCHSPIVSIANSEDTKIF